MARADPSVARQVRAEEKAAERARLEKEKERHVSVAEISRRLRELDRGVHVDWLDLARSHSGALSRVTPSPGAAKHEAGGGKKAFG